MKNNESYKGRDSGFGGTRFAGKSRLRRDFPWSIPLRAAFIATVFALNPSDAGSPVYLFAMQHELLRLRPGLPSASKSFWIDVEGGRSLHIAITASSAELTIRLDTPAGTIDESNIEQFSGSFLRVQGSVFPKGPLILPVDSPGWLTLIQLPSVGPGMYAVQVEANDVPTGEIAVIIELHLHGTVEVSLFPTESVVYQGRRAVLISPVFEDAQPKLGAQVVATVVRPSGDHFYLPLLDNGKHYDALQGDGLYSGSFRADEVGEYLVSADISGTTASGVPFRRTAATRVEVVQPCARFTGGLTEYGLDADWNGRFEAMLIRSEIEVVQPAAFLLEVELTTSSGKTLRARGRAELSGGIQVMDAKLSATDLWNANEDGPFAVTRMALTCEVPDEPPRPSDLRVASVEEAPRTQPFQRWEFEPPIVDCNRNGRPDDVDIATGSSRDCQPNGIPDECDRDLNLNWIADDCEGGQPPAGPGSKVRPQE